MKKQSAKPNVAPPASYKVPSLPTLATLGVITTAIALTTGCQKRYPPLGGIILPWDPDQPWERTPSIETHSLPCQYRVGSTDGGNTLWGIAKLFYGDGAKWPAIWEANKAAIPDPDVIRDGMLITIPKLPVEKRSDTAPPIPGEPR